MKSCPECYSEYEDSFETCPTDSTALKTIEKDPLIGSKLAGRYEIVSVVGRGGMGVVYKAKHDVIDKFIAIKMLHSHLVAEAEAVKRFHREAKTVSQVRHHHIITLYDFGMSALRQPYLVMDFLEGTSLKSVIKEEGPLSLERTEKIYQQVIDALATAHQQDLVHRDLKPENIMLSHYGNEDDWVTLVDFGLSKLKDVKQEDSHQITKVGDVCGSPPYMSPEQCLSSQVVDPRSDIYSLGICVFETLSGKLPFNAKSAIEMLDCHLYATPIPFNQISPEFKVCTELTHLLNKALQKDPDKRHQTVEEFGQEMAEAVQRDAVKLRAFRHRIENSQFTDLASEAEALLRSQQVEAAAAQQDIDGIQFLRDRGTGSSTSINKIKTDRRTLETDVPIVDRIMSSMKEFAGVKEDGKRTVDKCPYCNTPAEPGIKFCMNCKQRLLSPQEAARLRAQQDSYKPFDETGRGFSSRAKKNLNRTDSLYSMQRILTAVFLLVLAVGMVTMITNDHVRDALTRMVPALSNMHDK